jgi:hypothetical protein
VFDQSYWDFYRRVIKGELNYQDLTETPMTR